jgi:hypothetical protein
MTVRTIFRQSPSWGFPGFPQPKDKLQEICVKPPIWHHYHSYRVIDVLGISGRCLKTREGDVGTEVSIKLFLSQSISSGTWAHINSVSWKQCETGLYFCVKCIYCGIMLVHSNSCYLTFGITLVHLGNSKDWIRWLRLRHTGD